MNPLFRTGNESSEINRLNPCTSSIVNPLDQVFKRFAQFLSENLQEKVYPNQVYKLSKLNDSNCKITELRERILGVLQTVKEEDLGYLETLSKRETRPKGLKNVFKLARAYKHLDQVRRLQNLAERGTALSEIAYEFMRLGSTRKALDVAYTIPYESMRGWAICDICVALAFDGHFDKAIQFAIRIEYMWAKADALSRIHDAYIQKGLIDQAFEVASKIPNEAERVKGFALLKHIPIKLENNEIKQAQTIAEVIKNVFIKAQAYRFIAKVLAQKGEFDEAQTIADKISEHCDEVRYLALQDIACSMAWHDQIDQAIECVDHIHDAMHRDTVLSIISQQLLKLENPQQAIKVATEIQDECKREKIFEMITCFDNLDILSKLKPKSILELSRGSRTPLTKREFDQIKGFLNFLIEKLPEEDKTSKLLSIKIDIKSKNNLLEIRDRILDVLKDLNEHDITYLERVSKRQDRPNFLKNIFELTRIFKKIDRAIAIQNLARRGNFLWKISKELTGFNCMHAASHVVKTIPYDSQKGWAYRDICVALMQKGHFETAIELADQITYPWAKVDALKNIHKELLRKGLNQQAFDLAYKIPDEKEKGYALLNHIALELKKRNIHLAQEIAQGISYIFVRAYAYIEISKAWAEKGKFEEAVEMANTIPDQCLDLRDLALQNIVHVLLSHHEKKQAILIADQIQSPPSRKEALQMLYE